MITFVITKDKYTEEFKCSAVCWSTYSCVDLIE